jgi:hypothetical protein
MIGYGGSLKMYKDFFDFGGFISTFVTNPELTSSSLHYHHPRLLLRRRLLHTVEYNLHAAAGPRPLQAEMVLRPVRRLRSHLSRAAVGRRCYVKQGARCSICVERDFQVSMFSTPPSQPRTSILRDKIYIYILLKALLSPIDVTRRGDIELRKFLST